ncbi:MAG: hypothetical protein M3Y50_08865 [Acidobacteriota bacterium]|nr:hypothetical protein [Acidobacteriota bacterium]
MAYAQYADTPTLHVYADTVQLPILVLGPDQRSIKPIAASRFSLSFDGGPWFRVSHTRPEGNDPISLSILLDLNGGAAYLMPKMEKVLGELALDQLRAGDRISIYGLRCSLMRSVEDVPADQETVRRGVEDILSLGNDEKKAEQAGRCVRTAGLWDALAFVANASRTQHGQRVILVVTDGNAENGKNSAKTLGQVKAFAQGNGVSVFGLVQNGALGSYDLQRWQAQERFRVFCEMTGGMVFESGEWQVKSTLRRFVTVLRGRYIVEFPRPYNMSRGAHSLMVKIDEGGNFFVRPAGISVPLPDAAKRSDPMTVPIDPAKTPEMGRQKTPAPEP